MTYRIRNISWPEEGDMDEVIRQRRSTSQTLVKHPSSSHIKCSSIHGHFHRYCKCKHPTKISGHPMTTVGVFTPRLVVHPICRTTRDHAGSVRVWNWTGVRVEGKGKGNCQMRPRDPRAGLGWTQSWVEHSCWCCTEVCCRFSFWALVSGVILPSGLFERRAISSMRSGMPLICFFHPLSLPASFYLIVSS